MTDHKPATPLTGPLDVLLVFDLPRPKSHYGTGRNADKLKPSAPNYPMGNRNDVENLAKAVLDAMNMVIWRDDSQVVGLQVNKHYDAKPGVTIQITEV